MKLSNLILVGTLVTNAVLVGIFLANRADTVSAPPSQSSTLTRSTTSVADSSGSTTTVSKDNLSLWTNLYTDDIEKLMANLRGAGFPPKDVSEIALNIYFRRHQLDREKLFGRQGGISYWKYPYVLPETPEQRQKMDAYERQGSKEFHRLFGDALAFEPEAIDYYRRRFGDLPDEKIKQMLKVEADYQELQSEVLATLSTPGKHELSPADREKLRLLEQEQQRDIQQSLTPEEYAQYILRDSSTANRLRMQLQLFRATEDEYKTLFALQRPIDEKFSSWADGEAARKAYKEAIEQLKPQIETVLGAERYADYIQATEHGSDKLNRLMVRLDLPLATAGKVTSIREDISQRAETIRNDSQIDLTERSSRLAALAEEAKTKLTSTLGGPRGYNAYEDIKGDWIRDLQQAPSPSSKP